MKKRFFSIILIFIYIFGHLALGNVAFAEDDSNTNVDSSNNDEIEIYSDACVLFDIDTSKILYEKNAYQTMYPASTTKLMTAILVLEKFKDLSALANVSYYATHTVPATYSIADLRPNEQFSLKDLLYSLLVASANDSAYVLAEYVVNDGNNYALDYSSDTKKAFENSIATFSDMMNAKAKELGCMSTNFVNPNGVHNENHVSTAYDLSLIGQYAYKNSTLMTIVNTMEYSLPNSEYYDKDVRTFSSTNLLLRRDRKGYYEYANGLKTGYTDAAQSCIVASAEKDGINLIATVLHSDRTTDQNASRESDCIRLFEYGFNNFTYSSLVKNKDVVKNISILNGTPETKNLNVLSTADLTARVKVGEALDITPEINITKSFAPIAKDEVIGTVKYVVDDTEYTADLIAEHDVVADDYMYIIWLLLGSFAVILFLFTCLFHKKDKKKRKH